MENKDFIIEQDGKQFVDVVRLLPEALPSGKKILWKEVDEERIEISVDKNSARGGNAKVIVIKRFVPINELLFEGLGLRFGDGIKLQGGEFKVFGFSNTELSLHKDFLRFSKECFGLHSSKFRARISIPPKLRHNIKEIEKSISEELNIPSDKFFRSQTLNQRNVACVDVKISSILLGFIVKKLSEVILEIMLSSKEFCAAFLRGVIACEGNVALRRNLKLGEISIGAKDRKERDFLRVTLNKLNIIPDRDKEILGQECMLITGLSNFKLVEKWDLCKLNPNKEKNFKIGMKNFIMEEFRKGEGKFLILKSLIERPKRSTELENELNRCQQAINWNINKLETRGLVERFRVSKNIFWKITNRGTEILGNENMQNLLENLKRNN